MRVSPFQAEPQLDSAGRRIAICRIVSGCPVGPREWNHEGQAKDNDHHQDEYEVRFRDEEDVPVEIFSWLVEVDRQGHEDAWVGHVILLTGSGQV